MQGVPGLANRLLWAAAVMGGFGKQKSSAERNTMRIWGGRTVLHIGSTVPNQLEN